MARSGLSSWSVSTSKGWYKMRVTRMTIALCALLAAQPVFAQEWAEYINKEDFFSLSGARSTDRREDHLGFRVPTQSIRAASTSGLRDRTGIRSPSWIIPMPRKSTPPSNIEAYVGGVGYWVYRHRGVRRAGRQDVSREAGREGHVRRVSLHQPDHGAHASADQPRRLGVRMSRFICTRTVSMFRKRRSPRGSRRLSSSSSRLRSSSRTATRSATKLSTTIVFRNASWGGAGVVAEAPHSLKAESRSRPSERHQYFDDLRRRHHAS